MFIVLVKPSLHVGPTLNVSLNFM